MPHDSAATPVDPVCNVSSSESELSPESDLPSPMVCDLFSSLEGSGTLHDESGVPDLLLDSESDSEDPDSQSSRCPDDSEVSERPDESESFLVEESAAP